MSHPQQSTIDLLRRMVVRVPPRFPRELGRYMNVRVEELARDVSVPEAVLTNVIAEFGRYLWHYRKAWEDVWTREGAPRVAPKFLEMLSGDVRARVEADVGAGFTPARSALEIMRLPQFESAYTPEEKLVIEEAGGGARHAAEEGLRDRIDRGEVADYDATVLRWKQERLRIEEQLLMLEQIAHARPQHASEIRSRIAQCEEGMAGISHEPTLRELQGEVENYRNMG